MKLLLLSQSTLDQLPVPSSTTGWSRLPGFVQDIILVLCIGLILLVLLLIWASFFRRRSRHHSDLRAASHVLEDSPPVVSTEHRHRHHKHRRRRREHRPRNPTLAQTGGLPPPRPDNQAPPSI